jgi:hypothetical protein
MSSYYHPLIPNTRYMDLDPELEYMATEYDRLAQDLLSTISTANIYRLPIRYPANANTPSSLAKRAKYPATITTQYLDNLHVMYRYYSNLAGSLYATAHKRLPTHASDYADLATLVAELDPIVYYYL